MSPKEIVWLKFQTKLHKYPFHFERHHFNESNCLVLLMAVKKKKKDISVYRWRPSVNVLVIHSVFLFGYKSYWRIHFHFLPLFFPSQNCWTCSHCQWQLWVTGSMRACTSSLTSTQSRRRSSTRCITLTLTSCWGPQQDLVKQLQQRWPCSGSSTSTQAPRFV